MTKKLINPKELYDGSEFGISQAVIATETGILFISGQVDWNQQYETTEKSVEGQTRKALNNLKIVLENAGSSVDRLLHVRVYVRGELGEYMNSLRMNLPSKSFTLPCTTLRRSERCPFTIGSLH